MNILPRMGETFRIRGNSARPAAVMVLYYLIVLSSCALVAVHQAGPPLGFGGTNHPYPSMSPVRLCLFFSFPPSLLQLFIVPLFNSPARGFRSLRPGCLDVALLISGTLR